MKHPLKSPIAGETVRFELEGHLMAPEGMSGEVPWWDLNVTTPLAIWIASPDNNGIPFIDKLDPDRTRQQMGVTFSLPPGPVISRRQHR